MQAAILVKPTGVVKSTKLGHNLILLLKNRLATKRVICYCQLRVEINASCNSLQSIWHMHISQHVAKLAMPAAGFQVLTAATYAAVAS